MSGTSSANAAQLSHRREQRQNEAAVQARLQELRAEKCRLFRDELVAPIRTPLAEWYSGWAVVAAAARADDRTQAVAALARCGEALSRLQQVTERWLSISEAWLNGATGSDGLRPALVPHPTDLQELAPAFVTWAWSMQTIGGPAFLVGKLLLPHLGAEHQRLVDLLLEVEGASEKALQQHLNEVGVNWLTGLTPALACAVIPPIDPSHPFDIGLFPASEIERERVQSLVHLVSSVAGFEHVKTLQPALLPERARGSEPPPAVTMSLAGRHSEPEIETTTSIAQLESSVPNPEQASRQDGPFEQGGRFYLVFQGCRHHIPKSDEQSFRIIKKMWPAIHLKECKAGDMKSAVLSRANDRRWPTNVAAKARAILGRLRFPFTIQGDNVRQVLYWEDLAVQHLNSILQNADSDKAA